MHLLTFVKIAHLFGLVMGLGGAVLLDLTIFNRGIIRPISNYTVHQAEVLSRIVTAGLALLWFTGLALIWINLAEKPEYLTNQKLWAKIAIVIVLTVNGVFIHRHVLPILKEKIGCRLFDQLNRSHVALLTLMGSISFVSWTMPFVLGKASELNYVTPMHVILAAYCMAISAAWGGMFTMVCGLTRIQAFVRTAAARTLQESDTWEDMQTDDLHDAFRQRREAMMQQLERQPRLTRAA